MASIRHSLDRLETIYLMPIAPACCSHTLDSRHLPRLSRQLERIEALAGMAPSTRIKRSSTGRTRTAPEPISDSLPPQSIVKDEPGSPDQDATARAGPSYTTLRRSTRSSTSLALHLSSYAYSPVNGTTSAPATPPRKRIKVEPKPSTPLARTSEGAPTPRSSSKKMPVLALDKPHKEPERWREQYRLIEKMRRGIIAPVDDM